LRWDRGSGGARLARLAWRSARLFLAVQFGRSAGKRQESDLLAWRGGAPTLTLLRHRSPGPPGQLDFDLFPLVGTAWPVARGAARSTTAFVGRWGDAQGNPHLLLVEGTLRCASVAVISSFGG
jgi:hypothetical protein